MDQVPPAPTLTGGLPVSSAADGTPVMTVGSILPLAPCAAWLQHLRPPASDDPRHKPSGYLTDRTGVGRFMLTYLTCCGQARINAIDDHNVQPGHKRGQETLIAALLGTVRWWSAPLT